MPLYASAELSNAGSKLSISYDEPMQNSKIHPTSEVSESAAIGVGVSIWQYAHIRENAQIGENTIIGRGVYIGPDVQIGNNCKIQNYALIYEPAKLEDGVFIGPSVVLTNDKFPRAVNSDMTLKSGVDWTAVGVTVKNGASIGAGSICVAPIVIGEWALVAAGSTVIQDVPNYALVAGSPAKRINWVGKEGLPLICIAPDTFKCPKSEQIYKQINEEELVLQ